MSDYITSCENDLLSRCNNLESVLSISLNYINSYNLCIKCIDNKDIVIIDNYQQKDKYKITYITKLNGVLKMILLLYIEVRVENIHAYAYLQHVLVEKTDINTLDLRKIFSIIVKELFTNHSIIDMMRNASESLSNKGFIEHINSKLLLK